MDYRKVLSEIDESLVQQYDQEEKRWWRKEGLVAKLLKEYTAQHQDKKDDVRDILCAEFDFNCTSSWLEDVYLAVFNDKESYVKLLDGAEYDANLFCQLLKRCKDEDIIDKIFSKLAQKTDNEKTLGIYYELIREVQNEEVDKQILSQTDNEGIINLMVRYCSGFSDEFQRKLLHNPNLTCNGFYHLSECLPDSAFDDEVIERILKKIPSEVYDTSTTFVVNSILHHILDLRPNPEFAKKIFDCCSKLPNYGSNRFCYGSQEIVTFARLMAIDPSDEMANRILDYALANSHTNLFNDLLRMHPNADMLQKIEAYYEAYYKDKAEVKTEMQKTSTKFITLDVSSMVTDDPLKSIQKLMELEDRDIKFANTNALLAYTILIDEKILEIWKNNRTPEIDALIQDHVRKIWEDDTLIITPEEYENKIDENEFLIDDDTWKNKLRRLGKIRLPVSVSQSVSVKDKFDYIGYYKTMIALWQIMASKVKDASLQDDILVSSMKFRRKAQSAASKIPYEYERDKARNSIANADKELKSVYREGNYICQKLKQMYPRLSFEKAVAKAFKQMVTTTNKKEKNMLKIILMAEEFDFYMNYLENAEGKISPEILDYVLKEKEKLFDKLPQYDEYERERVYEKITDIENNLEGKNVIATVLKDKYPDLIFEEAIIREAARVVKSGDKKEMERFNNLILAEGECELLNGIDEKVCDYLVENFTQQNLDDVNALRSFYGLKIIIDETPFETPNLRTVRRMQFDDSVSTTDPDSEYYVVQYSEAYRNFVTARKLKYRGCEFKESDYYDMMDKSEAFQTLFDYGYADFAYALPKALAKAIVPPEVAVQFNIKDLQAIFYDTLPDEYKDVYGWDGDFLFTKQWIEIEGAYDSADLMGARASYWMDMVCNKQLVQTMKDDFLRHGISADDAEQLFKKAEEEGFPNAGRRWERVTKVKLQLHHVLGLKDGGLNYPSNYAPVAVYPDKEFNSHTPLHRYDTPKDKFYVVKGATKPTDVMLMRKQPSSDAKVVRIRTIFTDDEISPHKKVLFYGGARKCSRYVGRLHGMENIAIKAKQLGQKYREDEARSQLLMQIVFQNYVNMRDRLKEIETLKKNKEKKKKTEKRKTQMNRAVKHKNITQVQMNKS